MINKTALHADDRLKERTALSPSVLRRLRRRVGVVSLPSGTLHARLGGQGYAVLKDLGGRHVVATVLSRHMRPPGRDVTEKLMPNRPLDKLGSVLNKLLQVKPIPGGMFQMSLRASPKRGIPERVVGSISPDASGIVHASDIDPVLQGTGLAQVAYKRVAQQMPGGVLAGDRMQSQGSYPLWVSMFNKSLLSLARAEAAGKPLTNVIEAAPLSASYASGGAFMSPPSGSYIPSNFFIRMPAKSLKTTAPYRGVIDTSQMWPVGAGTPEATRVAESGFPFVQRGVRGWEQNSAYERALRGQPNFPPPNPKGTFQQFVRDTDAAYGPVRRTADLPGAQGPTALERTIAALKNRFAARNPFAAVSPDDFASELAAARERLFGQKSPKPFSALQAIRGPNNTGRDVTGYVTRPEDLVVADVRRIAASEVAAKQTAAANKQRAQQDLQRMLAIKGKSQKPVEPPAELLGVPEPGVAAPRPTLSIPAPEPVRTSTPQAGQQGTRNTPNKLDTWMLAPKIRALKDAWFAAGE